MTGISLPPASPVGGGILTHAEEIPGNWTRSVDFATEACLTAGEHLFCPTSPTEKVFQATDVATFVPVGVAVPVVCSLLSGEENIADREAKAAAALPVLAEYSVGYVLATGETQDGEDTGNPSLADATSVGGAATASAALALLEDSIASNLRGHLAWVHVTPATLAELICCGVVWRDFDGWRTPTGHVVVASPGYVGNIDGELVATTEVFASVGAATLIQTTDRKDNRYLAVHEAPALAVFDPCFNVSVGVETSP